MTTNPSTFLSRGADAFRRGWSEPRLSWGLLLALSLALALRNLSALHTPQLWAEDGSIFLNQNDTAGLRAFLEPYAGYLHTIPRLIAWTTSKLADPRWWPACYNGAAFVICVGVVARIFSTRLALPGKPWLALALIVAAFTDEVFFNITNLQWITAFLLVMQLLIARPANAGQRAGDLGLIALVGLTGPFVIPLAPFFAWRWWRDRHADHLAAALLAAACAAVQAAFVLFTGPHNANHSEALHLGPLFQVIGRRLVAWPLLGEKLAQNSPPFWIGLIGCLILAAFLAWTLRADRRRAFRAPVFGLLVLFLIAGMYRSRPDTWVPDHLANGDRYFFIPRVLLFWLLVWEFDARPRLVAWLARATALAIFIVHLPGYAARARPDYHWAQHCEPVRRGVPAKIPTLPDGWIFEYQGRPPGH